MSKKAKQQSKGNSLFNYFVKPKENLIDRPISVDNSLNIDNIINNTEVKAYEFINKDIESHENKSANDITIITNPADNIPLCSLAKEKISESYNDNFIVDDDLFSHLLSSPTQLSQPDVSNLNVIHISTQNVTTADVIHSDMKCSEEVLFVIANDIPSVEIDTNTANTATSAQEVVKNDRSHLRRTSARLSLSNSYAQQTLIDSDDADDFENRKSSSKRKVPDMFRKKSKEKVKVSSDDELNEGGEQEDEEELSFIDSKEDSIAPCKSSKKRNTSANGSSTSHTIVAKKPMDYFMSKEEKRQQKELVTVQRFKEELNRSKQASATFYSNSANKGMSVCSIFVKSSSSSNGVHEIDYSGDCKEIVGNIAGSKDTTKFNETCPAFPKWQHVCPPTHLRTDSPAVHHLTWTSPPAISPKNALINLTIHEAANTSMRGSWEDDTDANMWLLQPRFQSPYANSRAPIVSKNYVNLRELWIIYMTRKHVTPKDKDMAYSQIVHPTTTVIDCTMEDVATASTVDANSTAEKNLLDIYNAVELFENCKISKVGQQINQWLSQWDSVRLKGKATGTGGDIGHKKEKVSSKSTKKNSKFISDEDSIEEWSEGDDDSCEGGMKGQTSMSPSLVLILHGLGGVGKSALVHACAKRDGFNVMEVNTTQCRNSQTIRKLVAEAMQGSGSATSFFASASKADRETSTQNSSNKKSTMNLILFDEVDLVFQEDSNFHAALYHISKTSKCPIVLTIGSKIVDRNFLKHFENPLVIRLKHPSHEECSMKIRNVCSKHSSVKIKSLSYSDIDDLVKICNCDVRASLNLLSLLLHDEKYSYANSTCFAPDGNITHSFADWLMKMGIAASPVEYLFLNSSFVGNLDKTGTIDREDNHMDIDVEKVHVSTHSQDVNDASWCGVVSPEIFSIVPREIDMWKGALVNVYGKSFLQYSDFNTRGNNSNNSLRRAQVTVRVGLNAYPANVVSDSHLQISVPPFSDRLNDTDNALSHVTIGLHRFVVEENKRVFPQIVKCTVEIHFDMQRTEECSMSHFVLSSECSDMGGRWIAFTDSRSIIAPVFRFGSSGGSVLQRNISDGKKKTTAKKNASILSLFAKSEKITDSNEEGLQARHSKETLPSESVVDVSKGTMCDNDNVNEEVASSCDSSKGMKNSGTSTSKKKSYVISNDSESEDDDFIQIRKSHIEVPPDIRSVDKDNRITSHDNHSNKKRLRIADGVAEDKESMKGITKDDSEIENSDSDFETIPKHNRKRKTSKNMSVSKPKITYTNEDDDVGLSKSYWSDDTKGMSDVNKTNIMQVLKALQNHKLAEPFLYPVDSIEFPSYYDVIARPMDFSTIESSIEENLYLEVQEFIDDVHQVFENCEKFNLPNSVIVQNSNILKQLFASMAECIVRSARLGNEDEQIEIENEESKLFSLDRLLSEFQSSKHNRLYLQNSDSGPKPYLEVVSCDMEGNKAPTTILPMESEETLQEKCQVALQARKYNKQNGPSVSSKPYVEIASYDPSHSSACSTLYSNTYYKMMPYEFQVPLCRNGNLRNSDITDLEALGCILDVSSCEDIIETFISKTNFYFSTDDELTENKEDDGYKHLSSPDETIESNGPSTGNRTEDCIPTDVYNSVASLESCLTSLIQKRQIYVRTASITLEQIYRPTMNKADGIDTMLGLDTKQKINTIENCLSSTLVAPCHSILSHYRIFVSNSHVNAIRRDNALDLLPQLLAMLKSQSSVVQAATSDELFVTGRRSTRSVMQKITQKFLYTSQLLNTTEDILTRLFNVLHLYEL